MVGSGWRSFQAIMERLGPLIHGAGKVISYNTLSGSRIDMMRHVDALFTEDNACNAEEVFSNAFLALSKPAIMWSNLLYDEGCGNNIAGTSGAMGADGVMQRLLHVGSFPMAPIDGNDHSIQPTDYLSQHVALEECSDTNPAQLWTRSRSDLLHGSFVSSPAAGSVCLTPYDTNVSALKPGTAEAVAAVWLCCGNGTEHSCGSLVNHVFSFALSAAGEIATTDPKHKFCLTAGNVTTAGDRTAAATFSNCTRSMEQRWTFVGDEHGTVRGLAFAGCNRAQT